jgi:uncharacterized protein YkwD
METPSTVTRTPDEQIIHLLWVARWLSGRPAPLPEGFRCGRDQMTLRQFLAALRKALGGKPAPAPRPTPKPAPVPIPTPVPPPVPGDDAAQLLAEHNARRSEAGLPAYVPSVKLRAAAQGHATVMAQLGRMAHSGIGDGDPGSRLRGSGYAFRTAGENIAWNQRSVAEVMTSWLNSPGHRANILSPAFTEAGFAVAHGPSGPFWCAVFGSPAIAMVGAYAATAPYTVGTPEVTGDGRVAASSIVVAAD